MDLSKLSDAELEAMAGGGAPSPFVGMDDAQLAAIAGEPAAAPAAKPEAPGGGMTMASLGDAYMRTAGLEARSALGGAAKGVLAPGTLLTDALVNAGYGAHKLAAKTGAVSEPDPKAYYGKSDSYLPTTAGIAGAVDEGLDSLSRNLPVTGQYLRAPETPGERIGSAVVEGATGAAGGVGLGRVMGGGLGGFLAGQPGVQVASGAASGAASQGVQEAGGDTRAAILAGLLAGAATGAAGARVARPRAAPVPTTADLRDAKTAAYARSEAEGVRFHPDAIGDLDRQVRAALPGEGIFLDTNPKARGVVDPLSRSHLPDASGTRSPVTLERMDDIRQQAGKLARSTDPDERRTGAVLARHLDSFLDNADASHVFRNGGDPTAGIEALREGQAMNRRYAKASALDVALDKADLRASSTGTGTNGENTVRQNLRQIIQDPNSRAFRQFDPAEREAMRRIVEGSRTQNALRWGSRFAPTGTVSGILGLGAAASGYGALPLAGLMAKGAGDYLHGRNVRNLENLVKGGPGAGRRPSARTGLNAARGAYEGFLGAGRYR